MRRATAAAPGRLIRSIKPAFCKARSWAPRGYEAIVHPGFYISIGDDPLVDIAEGEAAFRAAILKE